MRLSTILLLATALHVCGRGIAQRVTMQTSDITLRQALDNIKEQTGYAVFGDQSLLENAPHISLSLKNATISQALDECLKGLPFTYEINDKFIYIKPKPKEVTSNPSDFYAGAAPVIQQQSIIHGHVQDTAGNPLEGASILVKSSNEVLHTNAKGEFELDNDQPNDTIIVSYVGYKSNTTPITQQIHYLYISLKSSENELDQTIIQAYGTTTRRFSVGDISTISADDIEQQPVSNIALALQGRIPGLLVTPTGGGIPGSTVLFQVRGQNTVGSTASSLSLIYDQPLIIVDGIPTATQNTNQTQLNSFVASSGLSPLNSLNPADIQSVSVLKDADATAIYGSQGANGVIVITTKRGHAGKTQLNINVNTGPNSPTTGLDMLNTQQYLQLRHEAIHLDGINLSTEPSYITSGFFDLLTYDTTKYTNWYKKFYDHTPMNTNVNLSVSGGTGNDSYILSGGYTRSTYNFPGNFADNRFSFHSGAHHESLNHKLTIDFGTDFSYDKNNSAANASPSIALLSPPDAPDLTTPSGDLVWEYKGVQFTSNYYAELKEPYSMQIFSLNSNIKMDYEIIPGLKVGFLAGYNRVDNKEYSAMPKSAQNPALTPYTTANFVNGVSQTIDIEPQINYRRYIGKGVLTALVGGTYKKNSGYSNQQQGVNYPDDALLGSIEGAETVTNLDDNSIYKYVGAFARLNYIYSNKYILNLTGRRDGSSNFGPSHQFGSFGSVGAGWIFSEEKWFKNALPFISFGKLSGDYGTNGTDGVGAYMYQPFYKLYNSYQPQLFQGIVPFVPNNLYNPDYTWASKHALNLHIDLGFIKDRILLGASWYQNRTGNQLASYPLSSLTGFSSVIQNMKATVQDRGVEITLSTKNIQHKNFNWSTTFNISTNRNKLISFPGLASSPYKYTYQIGKPTSTIYGFKYAGINDTTGLFQFYKGDGKAITSTDLSYDFASQGGDQVPISSGEPDFYGGLGNTFTYKNFSLSMFFQFSKSYAENYMAALYYGVGPGTANNVPEFVENNIWLQPGDKHAVFQRPTTGAYAPDASPLASEAQQTQYDIIESSGAYSNDTYLRLKTLSVSYQLPKKWVRAMHMANFSVFINMQNVLTFTNYKYGDPELPGQIFGIIPTQRIVAGGLNLSF